MEISAPTIVILTLFATYSLYIYIQFILDKKKKNNFRYYTRYDLYKEGKVACRKCIHTTKEGGCTNLYPMMIQPEEMYWGYHGILGCKYGEKNVDKN